MSEIIEGSIKNIDRIIPLSEIVEQVSTRAESDSELPVLSVNNALGFIYQSEQFENREVASEDTSNYKVVTEGVIAYNPARINVGSVALCSKSMRGIVSPMYVCFKTNHKAIPQYVYLFLRSKIFKAEMRKRLEGSVRLCLSFEALSSIPIPIPTKEEQQKIIKRIDAVVDKIEVEKSLLCLLNKQRQYMLRHMFI